MSLQNTDVCPVGLLSISFSAHLSSPNFRCFVCFGVRLKAFTLEQNSMIHLANFKVAVQTFVDAKNSPMGKFESQAKSQVFQQFFRNHDYLLHAVCVDTVNSEKNGKKSYPTIPHA